MTYYLIRIKGIKNPIVFDNEVFDQHRCNGLYDNWLREISSGNIREIESITKIETRDKLICV